MGKVFSPSNPHRRKSRRLKKLTQKDFLLLSKLSKSTVLRLEMLTQMIFLGVRFLTRLFHFLKSFLLPGV